MGKEYTIIIKTFERKDELWRLLKSIKKLELNSRILIADDSEVSYKKETLNRFEGLEIDYFVLPFDSGLSYGRNFLLEQVKTDYFLLCDDDFIFDENLDIVAAMEIMEGKKLDILGGYVRNYKTVTRRIDYGIRLIQKIFKLERKYNYLGIINIGNDEITLNYITNEFPVYTETDIVLNFFVAKKKSVELMGGWDNDLKLTEHTDFFIRCKKAKFRIGFTNKLNVKHFPKKKGKYCEYRNRYYAGKMLEKHNVSKINFNYDNPKLNHTLEYDGDGKIMRSEN